MPRITTIIFLIALVGAFVTAGCEDESSQPQPTVGEIDQKLISHYNADIFGYYHVRQDYRKCMYPMCGGYWLRSVNRNLTLCADGEYAEECYVADADFGEYTLQGYGYHLIAKGRIVDNFVGELGNFGSFEIERVWESASQAATDDIVFFAQDAGIRCITAPCPGWINGDILNWGYGIEFDKVNLSDVEKVSKLTIEAGYDGLFGGGILVAGYPSFIPGDSWFEFDLGLTATQFYLRAKPRSDDPQFCETADDCTWSRYGSLVESIDDCYCPMCHSHLVNKSTNASRHKMWMAHCEDELSWNSWQCPMVKCVMPPMWECVENTCSVAETEIVE